MAYVFDGNEDWGLKSAAKHMGISTDELIQHGVNGDIRLSIRKPRGFDLWLITLKPEASPKNYKNSYFAHNAHLFPEKVDATLLNLSQEDCRKLVITRLQQAVFESVYVAEQYGPLAGLGVLALLEGKKDRMPSCLYKKSLRVEELEKVLISNDPIYTIDLTDEQKNDSALFRSIGGGLSVLNDPLVERQFAIFKEGIDTPYKGIDLKKIESIDVDLDDVFVADRELQRFVNRNNKSNISFYEIKEGKWTSTLLSHLNKAALQAHERGICLVENMGNNSCIDKAPLIKKKYIANLVSIGAIINEKSEYFKYFCYLSSCDSCFYDRTILKKSREYLLANNVEVPSGAPSVLFSINWLIGNLHDEKKDDWPPKKAYLNEVFKERLGFSGKLAKNVAKTVLMTERATVK